jgi:hypothetical protein
MTMPIRQAPIEIEVAGPHARAGTDEATPSLATGPLLARGVVHPSRSPAQLGARVPERGRRP